MFKIIVSLAVLSFFLSAEHSFFLRDIPSYSCFDTWNVDASLAHSSHQAVSGTPVKAATARRIVDVLDSRVLVFDPPEQNSVKAFAMSGRIGARRFKDQVRAAHLCKVA